MHKSSNTYLPIAILLVLASFFAMPLLKLYNLRMAFYDMGLYLNRLEQTYNGDFWIPFFGHFQPLFYAFLPLKWLLPDALFPYAVLFVQSMVLIAPAFLLLANFGRLAAFVYICFFPVWYLNIFSFHFDSFAPLFSVLFFCFFKKGKNFSCLLSLLLLAATKEIYAVQCVFYGLFMAFNKGSRIQGLAAIVFFSFLSLIIFYVILPYFSVERSGFSGTSAYSWLGDDLHSISQNIFLNFSAVVDAILLDRNKLYYVFVIFIALAFIPVLSLKHLVPTIPIFAMSLFSSNPNHFGIGHHYTAGLVGPMIIAFVTGLPRARAIYNRVVYAGAYFYPLLVGGILIIHIAVAPSPIGRLFWLPKVWDNEARAYIPGDRIETIKRTIEDTLPKDKGIRIAIQNTVMWPPVSSYKNVFVFPNGVLTAGQQLVYSRGSKPLLVIKSTYADYLIIDMGSPWFLGDQGCTWLYGECRNPIAESAFLSALEQTRDTHDLLVENDGVLIFKINRHRLPKSNSNP